jgi:hypothetical protein
MKFIKNFGLFWYHFIVGDDWSIAVTVLIGLGLTYCLTHIVRIQVWWLLPVIILLTLSVSLWHETRKLK